MRDVIAVVDDQQLDRPLCRFGEPPSILRRAHAIETAGNHEQRTADRPSRQDNNSPARPRGSSSLFEWLPATRARRVSSGRLSHRAPKSHGPQLAMQALIRVS